MDARPTVGPQPALLGSIGYCGDWCVVDPRGFNRQSWLDDSGCPQPKRLPTVERFNPRDFGHLEVQVTIDDPQASTKPRSFPQQFEFLAYMERIEDVSDNQKDAVHSVGK